MRRTMKRAEIWLYVWLGARCVELQIFSLIFESGAVGEQGRSGLQQRWSK